MDACIAILDFGSQYTRVIARRIRECGAYSKIYPWTVQAKCLEADQVVGIILSGGPASVVARPRARPQAKVLKMKVPILGICYGMQILAHLHGGTHSTSKRREYGKSLLSIRGKSPLFKGLSSPMLVWNSHGDHLKSLPASFTCLASTEAVPYAAIAKEKARLYGLQFHPEVAHTKNGTRILKNFLKICECPRKWKAPLYQDKLIADIQAEVGDEKVILGLSGGVDSSVAAALIHKAIGKNLNCVFVDNGLLRAGEREEVSRVFRQHFKSRLKVVNASRIFLSRLEGVANPERKRKIIGKTFVEVFEKAIQDTEDVRFLAQGTIYPDVIESVPIDKNSASLIKSHHNVGGLPKRMKLKLLEPLRCLFKDEVRELGQALGLPRHMVWRHPFPGPGLAVRIMGEVNVSALRKVRQADFIFIEELKKGGHYHDVWQAFCVFLPLKTVGVMGDKRTYENLIALRGVESEEAMTARCARLPSVLLERVSARIINEVRGINRVVFDLSSKPPATIEWE